MSHRYEHQVGISNLISPSTVWRFRVAQAIVAGAPLSEPAQKITAEMVEGDLEKDSDVRIEAAQAPYVVHQEDEKFEWREVIRGNSRLWSCRRCYFTDSS